jgi:hypothetical protein
MHPDKAENDRDPITVTAPRACELSGFGLITIWKFIKDGNLDPVFLPAGVAHPRPFGKQQDAPAEAATRSSAKACAPGVTVATVPTRSANAVTP